MRAIKVRLFKSSFYKWADSTFLLAFHPIAQIESPNTGDNMLIGAAIIAFVISSTVFIELLRSKKRRTRKK